MVTFHLFVRPALAHMLGTEPRERRATAVFDADYSKRPGRAHVVRCTLEARDGRLARAADEGAQGSHVLTSMLGAEALAYLEVDRGDVSAGGASRDRDRAALAARELFPVRNEGWYVGAESRGAPLNFGDLRPTFGRRSPKFEVLPLNAGF